MLLRQHNKPGYRTDNKLTMKEHSLIIVHTTHPVFDWVLQKAFLLFVYASTLEGKNTIIGNTLMDALKNIQHMQ